MAAISVGGFTFYVEPSTASWQYKMNIKPFETYGGRVVQLLSCSIEAMSIEGHIRPKGWSSSRDRVSGSLDINQWQGMRDFEDSVKSILAYHESTGESVYFNFPEVGWDGKVFLVDYSNVRYEPDVPAVTYTIRFEIDTGFEGIQQAAGDYGLQNIPDGVGWVRNVYNTPTTTSWETVKSALEDFIDDVGTFDASNPADFYAYLEAASNGESKSDSKDKAAKVVAGKETLDDGTFAGKTAQKVVDTTTSFLERVGITVKG